MLNAHLMCQSIFFCKHLVWNNSVQHFFYRLFGLGQAFYFFTFLKSLRKYFLYYREGCIVIRK